MKIQISLSAAAQGTRFASKQRILIRLAKDEWYAATVRRVGKSVTAIADNGETFVFDLDEPARFVKILPALKVFKRQLSDEQVKNLLAGVSGSRAREAKQALPKQIQSILTKYKVTSIDAVTVATFKKIMAGLSSAQAVMFKRFMLSATKAKPTLNTAIRNFNIAPAKTVKVIKSPTVASKPVVTKIVPAGSVLKLQDVYLPEVDEFHDTSIPDDFARLVQFSENSNADADMENRVKLVADSVAKLRKQDVFRLLDENKDVLTLLSAYIVKHRPDLKAEVDESLDDLN